MKSGTLVDLSHPIHTGMTTQPALPPPVVKDHMGFVASRMHYAPGVEFRITRVDMVGNTGTYLDAPGHRYAEGADIAEVPLERMADLPGVVIRVGVGGGRAIDRPHLAGLEVAGRAVLIHTGWDTHWGTERYAAGVHPFLTAAGASDLRDRGALLVGVDSINVDDTSDPGRPAHTILLGAGIPIVENLTGLGNLPEGGFCFSAVPPRVVGMGSFPVRAWARVG